MKKFSIDWSAAKKLTKSQVLSLDTGNEINNDKSKIKKLVDFLKYEEEVAAWFVSGRLGVSEYSTNPKISKLIDLEQGMSRAELMIAANEISNYFAEQFKL